MKNHWVKAWKIPWTWKAIEIEAYDTDEETQDEKRRIRSWSLTLIQRTKIDHAGFAIEFDRPFRTWRFSFHDTRHWDYENERWKQYD